MNENLLEEFLSQEADAYTRCKLLAEIREQRTTLTPAIREHTFNRFNVTLNFEKKRVSLRDDLMVGPEGEYPLGIEEFEKALQERK